MELESLRMLPGAELVLDGLACLERQEVTETSLCVLIAAPRLRGLGLTIPPHEAHAQLPEHRLYALLAQKYDDEAHSRYNALLRRLVAFARALDHVVARQGHTS